MFFCCLFFFFALGLPTENESTQRVVLYFSMKWMHLVNVRETQTYANAKLMNFLRNSYGQSIVKEDGAGSTVFVISTP